MLDLRWLRESQRDHQRGVCSKWVRAKNTAQSLLSPVGPRAEHLPSVHSYQGRLVKSNRGCFEISSFRTLPLPGLKSATNDEPHAPAHICGALTWTKPWAPAFNVTNTKLWKCSWQNTHAASLPSFSWSPLLLGTLAQLRCSNSFVRNMGHWEGSFFKLPFPRVLADLISETSLILIGSSLSSLEDHGIYRHCFHFLYVLIEGTRLLRSRAPCSRKWRVRDKSRGNCH